MTTTAYASQKRWVGVDCDNCGTRYSCLVEATGQSSDSFLPFSDDSLKELALIDLNEVQQKKAASVPCPSCGMFPQSHVERVRKTARAFILWGLSVAIFVLLAILLAIVAPKAPVWTLLIVLAVSLILPRLFSGPLADKFDPNRDLQRNLRFARIRMANGTLRTQPPASKE